MANTRSVMVFDVNGTKNAFSLTKAAVASVLNAIASGKAPTLEGEGFKCLGPIVDGGTISAADALKHLTALASGE